MNRKTVVSCRVKRRRKVCVQARIGPHSRCSHEKEFRSGLKAVTDADYAHNLQFIYTIPTKCKLY